MRTDYWLPKSLPYNEDELRMVRHAKSLRDRAYQWELRAHRSWQKRLGQQERKRQHRRRNQKHIRRINNVFK